MNKINIEEMLYQIELVDDNGNAEIIEENIKSLDEAEEKALNFINYESNLSEYDKKKSYVLVSLICESECDSLLEVHYFNKEV